MPKLPTIDELREQLEVATQRLDEADAAITAAGPEVNEETLGDLEQRFDEDEAEVKRIASAINRHERREEAIGKGYELGPKPSNGSPARVVNEPLTYRPSNEGGQHSFLADIYTAHKGDPGAQSRLASHQREMAVELRAGTTTATQGGEFIPPNYLGELWAEKRRAGRPFANRVRNLPLPNAGMTLTIPRVTTGTETGSQATENSALANQDVVTDDKTVNVRTIGGYVDISRQLLDRSEPGFDTIIFDDMVRDYAQRVDVQTLNGAGTSGTHKGVLQDSNRNTVTWTEASPTAAKLYPKIAEAASAIATNHFADATGIFVHPRRWFWLLGEVDGSQRPLVVPVAPQNAMGDFGTEAEGLVGSLMGYPVYIDANIPSTNGAGTNEDAIIVSRLEDNLLWEAAQPAVEVSEHPGFHTATVRFRLFAYSAYTTERTPKCNASVAGTGLIDPFA